MDQSLEHKRHTLAHLLAAAVLQRYPHAKLTLGPAIDNGFYYDIDFSAGETPGDSDLKGLQKDMKKLLNKWTDFTHEEVSAEQAREAFAGNKFKLELIDEIEGKSETITLYTCGGFTDLCRGGHCEHPNKDINADAFKLDKIAGAYWRGDEKNPMLTRIYGLAFETKEELEAYEKQQEEAKARDHRKLGKELDLFTFSELIGPGLPLFTPKGTLMRDLIVEKIMKIQAKFGYTKVTIPHITKSDLYKTSGHWDKFKDELFHVKGQSDAEFVMKPMNCPHHTQIFDSRPRSYKELPIRYAETTMVYRDEQAGELIGLSRVRSITQDDGHVFCTVDQIEQEVENILNVIKEFYTALGMYEEGKFWVSLSVSDPNDPDGRLGDDAVWDKAESTLEEVAKRLNLPYKRVEGEAAFYGPKIDFMFYDAIGRERQLGTAQLDFVMPSRFGLTYTDNEGNKQIPVMIHRAIAGSLERFMAVMIEHFAGNFPLWLSPVQLAVIPVADAHNEYAREVAEILRQQNFRVELDDSKEGMGKKIRAAKQAKLPYFIVIGDKEVEGKTITLESRDAEGSESLNIEALLAKLSTEASV
ncbi:MAG: threonine--tRNA ligase [Candidatus Kaiserbacteria bacterium]|nr:threonine--tRNA ligase [Candidatus Kaiserbacteria bacterium]MCB9816242.1 threonine--tRNA ligase [Candidatus Nomurabacteria bacterium]